VSGQNKENGPALMLNILKYKSESMKTRLTILMMYAFAIVVVFGIAACNKTCKENGNINYGIGTCVDETAGMPGSYSGYLDSLPDSINALRTATLLVTRVNDGEIQITIPAMPQVPPINAELSDINVGENGWLLSVPLQTSKGTQISSAANYLGTVTDGSFAASNKALQIGVMVNPGQGMPAWYLRFNGWRQ
jgi:hypothetical protein